MTVRVEVVTPCEHGDYREPHDRTHAVKRDDLLDLDGQPLPATWVYTNERCPGGFARSFTEWPPEAKKKAAHKIRSQTWRSAEQIVEAVSAVLWSHITGDSK